MNTLELIARLREAGIKLTVSEGKIRLKAAKGSLTDELKQEITAHKQEIIALLSNEADAAPAAQRVSRDGPLPLSYAQQRLWFLDELEPGTPVYNMPFALEVQGPLDAAALQQAFDELLARHESLRTVFVATDNEPQQRILDELRLPLNREDLQSVSAAGVQARMRELAVENFSLANGPLLRLHLLQTGTEQATLMLVIHHIVSDLWSMDVFFQDLGQLYARQMADVAPALEALPLQYVDYAGWQRELLRGPRLQRHLDYWLKQLADAPPMLELPTDRPRPPEPGYQGRWLAHRMAPATGQAAQALAQQSGATLFMLTCAVFIALMHKYSGEDDVVVGTPISGRQHTEFERLIGFFLNTLALRTDVADDPPFAVLLERLKQAALGAYAHQDLPFEKLVEELQPERDMSHTPVFQHMFIWQDGNQTQLQLPGLTTQPAVLISHDTAKFDLTLALTNSADGIEAGIEYNTDLFDAATIERMLGHYETLLRAVVANPQARLSELSLLDAGEAQTVVQDFNATDTDVTPACVHRLVEAQAAQTPAAIAVSLGNDTLSYAELNRRANQLGQHLRQHGAATGTVVAIAMERSLELPVAALAVLKSGACYVPVDPNYPTERIEAMLADSGATVVLSQSGLSLPALPGQDLTRIDLDDFEFGNDASDNLDGGQPQDPLYCIYTSGSTGRPKGVQLAHAGLHNLLQWQLNHPRLGTPAKTLQFASFSFDVHFQEFFGTWSNGGEVVMVDEELRQDLPRLAGFINDQKIERLYLPYAALQPIAETLVSTDRQPQLRDVVVAGEQLQVSPDVRALFNRLSDAALHNQYGPSETHVVTALTLTGAAAEWPALPAIGAAVANTRCYVLDASGAPCPIGIPGELYLGGVQVALGYLHRPELTAEKFLASPFVDGERLYRTGDRVRYLANGELEFLGRADDQVKWRGFRIEPGEIEAQLSAAAAVQQAVVVLREDTPGDKRLVAYVVGDNPDAAALKQTLKEALPDYMVPGVIVVLDELPLTPSGKVARRRLPVPEYSRDDSVAYVAPRNPTEEVLVQLWAEVLGVPAEQPVGVHDDFFALGGHSLLATQLVSRVRKQLGVSLPLKYIFRYPSPGALGSTVITLKNALEQGQSGAEEQPGNTAQTDDSEERDEFRI